MSLTPEEKQQRQREHRQRYYYRNREALLEKERARRNTDANKKKAREYEKQYRAENPDVVKKANRKSYLANTERHVLANIRTRAAKLGVPCTITVEDIIPPAVCPVLGIPLERHRKGYPAPNSPSVDRIVPELGYIPGNVIVISHKANAIKQNATPAEIKAVADFYERLLKDAIDCTTMSCTQRVS